MSPQLTKQTKILLVGRFFKRTRNLAITSLLTTTGNTGHTKY